jgi:High potential iron-sulfur protein
MTMQRIFSRRALIDGALKAFPVLIALDLGIQTASAATLPPLDPSDPTAKALGYVNDSTKPDQKCATCAQFTGQATDSRGGCNIFAGKSVAAGGWCSVWAKKA